jgi:hypothetical protein
VEARSIPEDVDDLVETIWLDSFKTPATPYQMLTRAIMADRSIRPFDMDGIQDAVARALRQRMRGEIAREWLAHFDDVRVRDRDSADRIFADAETLGHQCEIAAHRCDDHAARGFSCSACVVDDAFVFADACLGAVGSRRPAG